MRSLTTFIILISMTVSFSSCQSSQGNSSREDLGWDLGTQAYTFRKFSFFDAVDKTKELGLKYIEAYPGQEISGKTPEKMNYDISPEIRTRIKEYLDLKGIQLVSFGVIVPQTRPQWDSLFAFAQDMGIRNIVSEPRPEDLPFIDSLCQKYEINVAIHNHPKPSHYWSPDTLLAAISGLSNRIGSCADVGHFVRSELDPIESLKKLKGHIIESHFKDVASKDPEAADTIWGTGVCNVPGMMQELKDLGFKGVLSIEYEADPEDNMNQIKKSISFFDQELNKLH